MVQTLIKVLFIYLAKSHIIPKEIGKRKKNFLTCSQMWKKKREKSPKFPKKALPLSYSCPNHFNMCVVKMTFYF